MPVLPLMRELKKSFVKNQIETIESQAEIVGMDRNPERFLKTICFTIIDRSIRGSHLLFKIP